MKSSTQMTLTEIEYLVHVHEWLTEKERREMFLYLAQIRSGIDLIIQRASTLTNLNWGHRATATTARKLRYEKKNPSQKGVWQGQVLVA